MNSRETLSIDPVNKSATPSSAASRMPVAEHGLRVGRSALQFNRADPGEDSFLILKVTPPRPNTPVTISTDLPELFQVAVGVDRLMFGPSLTFTPEAIGTYIHVRYSPRPTRRHRGHLIVKSPDETLSVSLSGPDSHLSKPLITSLLTTIVLVAVCTLYVNRCLIWPDTCGPTLSKSIRSVPSATVSERLAKRPAVLAKLRPAAPLTAAKLLENGASPAPIAQPPTMAKVRNVEPVRATPRPEKKPAAVAAQPEPISTPRPEVADNKAVTVKKPTPETVSEARTVETKPAKEATAKPTKKPVAKPRPGTSSEESDLERVLNGRSNQ